MATRDRNLGGTVRRYSSRARVVTEVQPTYRPSSAARETFEAISEGFQSAQNFLRPAVEKEQAALGEQDAMQAIDDGSFEMRDPFTLRSAAFNKTGERVISNRAMIELDEAMRNAVRSADGSMSRYQSNAAEALANIRGELPNIPGLETQIQESYDRAFAAGQRQTTELARRRAIAAQRQAAQDAAAAVASQLETLALTSGTAEELSAALTDGQNNLAQYGPAGEFTLNGVTYPADPSRAGMYTARQLETMMGGLSNDAHELFLRADFERSDSPSQWADEWRATTLAGESPLPAGRSLQLLNSFESQARTRENALRAEENRISAQLRDARDAALVPYVTMTEAGVAVAMPQDERAAVLETLEGHPELQAEFEMQLAAADAVVEIQGLSPADQVRYFEDTIAAFEATPGVSQSEAAVINSLAPYLRSARAAITRETVGVSAGEQLISRGGIPAPEQFAAWRDAAAGNPRVLESIAVLEDTMQIIQAGQGLTGLQREEMINNLTSEAAELAVVGDQVGAAGLRRQQAAELALQHFQTIGDAAQNDPVRFAAMQGLELAPLVEGDNAELGDIARAITTRVGQLRNATAQYGNDTPVPLSASEREAVRDFFAGTNNAARVDFVETILELPTAQADAILEDLGADMPEITAAALVRDSNPGASRTILAGMNANVGGTGAATVQAAEGRIAPLVAMQVLTDRDLGRVRSAAEAYARGKAVRDGQSEIRERDLEDGYDIAFGADSNGDGGLEYIDGNLTILPPGVTGRSVERALNRLSNERAVEILGGAPVGTNGVEFGFDRLLDSVNGFRPLGDGRLVPMRNGRSFFVKDADGQLDLLTISIEDLLND